MSNEQDSTAEHLKDGAKLMLFSYLAMVVLRFLWSIIIAISPRNEDGTPNMRYAFGYVAAIVVGIAGYVAFSMTGRYHESRGYTPDQWHAYIDRKCVIRLPKTMFDTGYEIQRSHQQALESYGIQLKHGSGNKGHGLHFISIACVYHDAEDVTEQERIEAADKGKYFPSDAIRARGGKYDSVMEYTIFSSDPTEFTPPKMMYRADDKN